MVFPLGPGKFYGSSLPRPRIYTDVKFSDKRVDPTVPVLDPLMGGLSFERLRLQDRIDGNVKKLQAEFEKLLKKRNQSPATNRVGISASDSAENKNSSPSPPLAPIARKRRRFVALMDEEDDDEEVDRDLIRVEKEKSDGDGDGDGDVGFRRMRMPARKLADEFDRVATDSGLQKNRGSPVKNPSAGSETVASRIRSRSTEKEKDDSGANTVMVAVYVNESNSKGKKLKCHGERECVAERGFLRTWGGNRTSPRFFR